MSDPRVQKGIRAAQSGKLKRAVEIFQTVLKSDPTNADALNFEGVARHQLGQSERAIILIRKSLTQDPDNANAHTNLGNVYKELDRHDDAEEAYRAALSLDPLNAITLNNIATVQRNAGDLETAIATLREALRISPKLAQAYHNLGICLHHNGQHGAAINAYRDSFTYGGGWSDPIRPATLLVTMGMPEEAEEILVEFLASNKNHEAANFHLAAIRGETVERASDAYVANLFDGFAASFDSVLNKLGYNTPMRVADVVKDRLGEPSGDKDMLDLGCGTGLCGPLIAPYKSTLIGVDLSSQMLARAKRRDCYDKLVVAELQSFMRKQREGSYDVVICADTLIYLGALDKCFAGIQRVLRPGGSFVGSTEKLDDGSENYVLGVAARFKHSRGYIESLAEAHDLNVSLMTECVLRKEGGKPVEGLVFELLSRK